MSTRKPLVVANADAAQIPALRKLCIDDGGTFETVPEPGGTFTTVCRWEAPAPSGNTGAAKSAAALASSVSPNKKDRDLKHLHPVVRKKVKSLQKKLDDANIPMRLFEGFRTPQRQAYLYAKGRTMAGPRVTNAKPWQSFHQYGLAADFVRFENGGWNWHDNTPQRNKDWDDYHDLAHSLGLEPLSWERPHVQMVGITLTEVMNGDYPDDGDESWSDNLSAFIGSWGGAGAPPLPESDIRPAMPAAFVSNPAPASGGLTWHSRFGGDAWAYDRNGLYTRDHWGQIKTWRTPGAPITVSEVLAVHGDAIQRASDRYGVAKELIVMTIATETAAYRLNGFTGPKTFRWEQGYQVQATGNPAWDGKEYGDYSAGPMQVLSDTARWMNTEHNLGYTNNTDFPFFKNRPKPDPKDLPIYQSEVAIDVGTAYIRHNFPKTGDNPLLVAAAYNAGGLYPSSKNHWRIHSHGNHLDRAAEWYGDAAFVLNT